MDDRPRDPTGSPFALDVLLVLVVLSPWPFGSVHSVARWLIAFVCLLTATGIVLVRLGRREAVEVPTASALAATVFLLGVVQLVPVPHSIHAVLAPGSAAVWHPDTQAAVRILGDGPRPISIYPDATWSAVGSGLGLVALATLAMPALRDRQRAARTAYVVVGSGLAVAACGLVGRLFFDDKLFGVLEVPTVAPFGPFVSKNHFAGYVEMATLLALGLAVGLADEAKREPGPLGWMRSRRAPKVILAYGAAGALSLAVLVSLSRGGVVSLVSGLAVLILFRSRRLDGVGRWRRRSLMLACALAATAATLLVLPPEARDRLESIGAGKEDSSTVLRTSIWGDALRLAGTSPLFGHGLGSFVDALPRVKTGAGDMLVEHAENDYLELLAEGGVIGLASGLGAVVVLAFRLSRHPSDRGDRRLRRGLLVGSAAGLAAIGVHSLLDFNLRIPSNSLLVSVLAALALAGQPPPPKTLSSRSRLVLLPALALLLLLVPPKPKHLHDLDSLRPLRGREPTPLRLRQMEGAVTNHVRGRPGDAEAWLWLAWAYAASGRRDEGRALAEYGASLDPRRRALRETAARLAAE